MNVNKIIKERRKELNLTLKQVADELGVSEGLISRYESNDVKNMRVDKLVPLAKILKTTPAHLMGWDEYTSAQKNDLIKKIKEAARLKNINVSQIKEIYNIKDGFDCNLHTNILLKIAKDFDVNTYKANYLSNSKNSETLVWIVAKLNELDEEQLKQLKTLMEPIFTLIKSR